MSRQILRFVLTLSWVLILVRPGRANDYIWASDFTYAGFNGRVCDAVVYNGDLVVTGLFNANGGVAMSNAARWDGVQWQAMGDPGFFSESGFALGIYNNELYASGYSGAAGRLVKWDGMQWVDAAYFDFQSGTHIVSAPLVEYDGLLIVTGDFFAGGIRYMAGWDGTQWVGVGDRPSLAAVFGPSIWDMVVYDGSLYAAGTFTQSIGGVPMRGLARWDGTTWTGVEGRVSPGDPLVEGLIDGTASGSGLALTIHDGRLVVGGKFSMAGELPAGNVAAFDASTELWENVGSVPYQVISMSSNGTSLLAQVAHGPYYAFELHRYDGTSWSMVGVSDGPDASSLNSAMRTYNGKHVLVSEFHDIDLAHTPSIATWDEGMVGSLANPGSGKGLPRRGGALAEHQGEIITTVAHGTGEGSKGIMAFDGSNWRYIARWLDDSVYDIVSDGTFLYASGVFSTIETNPVGPIVRWDGSSWTTVGSSPPSGARLAFHNGQLHACNNGAVYRLVGDTWGVITLPNQGASAIASYGGKLIASSSSTTLRAWNGSSWTTITGANGGSLDRAVRAFAEFEGDLVMVGGFETVDGTPGHVAVWDGTNLTSWTAVELPGSPGSVSSVAEFDGKLVVGSTGGSGLWISDAPGSPFETLAGGISDGAGGLLVCDGRLYVSGRFGAVGDAEGQPGVVSSHIACLSPAPTAVAGTPSNRLSLSTFPNPFNPNTTIRYNVDRPGRATLVIYDLRGRAVRTLVDGEQAPAGEFSVNWDGRNQTGLRVATGVYFCRFTLGAASQTRKLVLLK